MNIFIIILLYVISIFVSRFLNKVLVKKDRYNPIWVFVWFMPGWNVLIFSILFFIEIISNMGGVFKIKDNWFTGKNW